MRMSGARVQWLVVALGVVAAACSGETKTEPTTTNDAAAADAGNDVGEADTAADTGSTAADTGSTTADAVADAKTDAGPADTGAPTGCLSNAQCIGKVPSLKANCEIEQCVLETGLCEAAPKPGSCCDSSQCNDGVDCTNDLCDPESSKCVSTPTAKCLCPDQKSYLGVTFEQNTLEGFSANPDPAKATAQNPYTNGNVKWQIETKRAHSGKNALYFGNECYSYDVSMQGKTNCVAGNGVPVQTVLKVPEVTLDAGKPQALDFWLWMDTQPLVTAASPASAGCVPACGAGKSCVLVAGKPQCMPPPPGKGNCKTPCAAGQTCLDVGGGSSACFPEKDVLFLKQDGLVLWDSTKIGNSTGGQWQHIAVTLTGQAPVLTFEFKTTDGLKNNHEGIYLDDVRVRDICPKETPACDAKTACEVSTSKCKVSVCTPFGNGNGNGLCFYDSTPGCCEGVADCDDKNTCTVDSCQIATGATQGLCKNVPDTGNDQCCQPEGLFSDDFASGNLTKWDHVDTLGKAINWKYNPQCQSGGCMYFGNEQFTGYDDPTLGALGPRDTVCLHDPVTLKKGTLYDVLSFNLQLTTEWTGQPAAKYKNPPGSHAACTVDADCKVAGEFCVAGLGCAFMATKIDVFNVIVKPEGAPVTVWSSDAIAGTTEGKYVPVSVPLDQFAGKSVRICFQFDAGDSAANVKGGAWVDDVKIAVACQKTECTLDNDKVCVDKCAADSCSVPTCSDNLCECKPIKDCCVDDKACDDGDSCTADSCDKASKQCKHTLTDPKCCSDKSLFTQAFEDSNGKLPSDWLLKAKTGNAQGGLGSPYDKNVKWNVSALKAQAGTWSLNFGNNGTYNAGANVAAGEAWSPAMALPTQGYTLLTFDLNLSTEWDPPSTSNPADLITLGIVKDRLRVGLFDPAATKDATTWVWNSYTIGGTTQGGSSNGWQSVVIAMPPALAGKAVQLVFEFDAGDNKLNNYAGAFVDNVQVQSLCAKPLCIADADCPNSDPCKKVFCAKDGKTGAFGCQSGPKAGPGCCAVSAPPIAAMGFEGNSVGVQWQVANSGPCADTGWKVNGKKKLNGNFELYFGNPGATCDPANASCVKPNYDCPGVAVSGELCTVPFQLSTDTKKSAQLTFSGWFNVEPDYETFQVTVAYQGTAPGSPDVVFDKNGKTKQNPNNPKTSLLLPPKDAVGKFLKCGGEFCTPVTKTIDLSAYKGKGNLKVCFSFSSEDNAKNNQYEGIYLDDVTFSEPCQ
jgi:hypothetical protein